MISWHDSKKKQQALLRLSKSVQLSAPRATLSPFAMDGIQRNTLDHTKLRPGDLSILQGSIGNQRVQRMLLPPTPSSTVANYTPLPHIQPKVKVGPVGEKFEQEADRVARQVTSARQPALDIWVQRKIGVQRADEIIPLEDYGDVSLTTPNPSLREAKPSNRMKPAEDKAKVAERLRGRADPKSLAQQSDDIGVLYAHAQMLQPFYNHALEQVAKETKGTYKPGPIKELGRTMDKVTTDYTDKKTGVQRPELVKDLLRSSIVYNTAGDLVRAMDVIKKLEHKKPSIKIRNLKNKFSGKGGYGDINMSMEVGDGYIGELQLHLSKFWDIKMSKGDHHLYEQISQLERAKQGGNLKGMEESSVNYRIERLKERQAKTYNDALNTEADPAKALKELSAIAL